MVATGAVLVLEEQQRLPVESEVSSPSTTVHAGGVQRLLAPISSILLPRGFPTSVAPEYMQYQLWDTLQVMMADLRSILISNAGLIGQGVGVANASPLQTLYVDFQVQAVATIQVSE